MQRDYNCFNCVNKSVCEKNSAYRNQCRDSITNRIKFLQNEKHAIIRKYNTWIKNLKHKRKELK